MPSPADYLGRPALDQSALDVLLAPACDCADQSAPTRCGNCDFAPKLRPRLSLTLADQIHDAVTDDDRTDERDNGKSEDQT